MAHHTFTVDQNQRNAWQAEISHLQEVASVLGDSFFFLEFAIPRMGKRADAVIITGGVVFVIEYKVGADDYEKHALDQVLDYALDLFRHFEAETPPACPGMGEVGMPHGANASPIASNAARETRSDPQRLSLRYSASTELETYTVSPHLPRIKTL